MSEWDEDRIDVVGSNGNDGLHYKLKPLKNEEIEDIWFDLTDDDDELDLIEFARAIEKAHGIQDE